MSRGVVELEGTGLEVVAYVNAGGTLVVRINKDGICVADIGLQHATDAFTPNELMEIGALTRPVLRDLRKARLNDLLADERGGT